MRNRHKSGREEGGEEARGKERGGGRVATLKMRGREEMEKEARREGRGEGMNLIVVTKINNRQKGKRMRRDGEPPVAVGCEALITFRCAHIFIHFFLLMHERQSLPVNIILILHTNTMDG